MVRTRLNIGCRYSTPVRERPLHPTRGHFTPEPSQTQAPVTPATEPERRAGGSLTTPWLALDVLAHLPGAFSWSLPHWLRRACGREPGAVPGPGGRRARRSAGARRPASRVGSAVTLAAHPVSPSATRQGLVIEVPRSPQDSRVVQKSLFRALRNPQKH